MDEQPTPPQPYVTLIPVEYDPWAQGERVDLVPVAHDPFAPAPGTVSYGARLGQFLRPKTNTPP